MIIIESGAQQSHNKINIITMNRFTKTNYEYVYNEKVNNTYYIETKITYKNPFGEYPTYVTYGFE